MTHQKAAALEPLRDLLGEVIGRLEALETKVGLSAPPASSSLKQAQTVSSTSVVAPGTDLQCLRVVKEVVVFLENTGQSRYV
jgi:hypothetical protein